MATRGIRGDGDPRSATLECNCPPGGDRRDILGRTFREWSRVKVLNRTVTGIQPNHVWLYSVDELEDVNSHRVSLQIARWRARFDDQRHPIWFNRSRYNIRSTEQWDSASKVIDAYLGGSKLPNDPTFREDFVNVDPGAKRRRGREDLIDERAAGAVVNLRRRLKEEKSARAAETAAARKAQAWKRQLKRHVGTYRHTLNDFLDLLREPGTDETEVHNFISERNPFWLFGLEYLHLDCRVPFPQRAPKFFFDIMLRRMDGFHDLVELKGPHDTLFDRRTKNRWKLNTKLAEALGQVIVYLDACDRFRRSGLFKPKAVIVIGNRNTDNARQRKLLASRLAHVEILTYTELAEHGRQLLKHLEGWKA